MVKDNEEGTELQQDEYHYSDPDSPAEAYVEEHEPREERPVGRSPLLAGMGDDRIKRIVVILVVVALVFVMLHLLKPRSIAVKPKSELAASMEQAAPPTPTVPTATNPLQIAPTPMPAPSSTGVTTAPPSNEITKLTEQSQKNAADIQQLSTSLENLQANVLQLAEVVKALNAQPKKEAHVHRAYENVKRRHRHKEKSFKMSESEVYYLKAAVPRRAWLQTMRGDTLTVAVGDSIKGYGTVESIDPSEGTVTTSSHKIIHYSANDN